MIAKTIRSLGLAACILLVGCAASTSTVRRSASPAEAAGPAVTEPTEGDELIFEVRSLDSKTVQIRDPLGRVDTDLVHEIPNCDRNHGQGYGGERGWSYESLLIIVFERPLSGVYEIEVATDVPNGFMLLTSGWSWGTTCELRVGDYRAVAPGRYTWEVDFRRDPSGHCDLEAQ